MENCEEYFNEKGEIDDKVLKEFVYDLEDGERLKNQHQIS